MFPANTVDLPANAISGEKKARQSWNPNTPIAVEIIIKCSKPPTINCKLYQYVRLKNGGRRCFFIAFSWSFCVGRMSPFDAKNIKLAQYLLIF